MSRSTSILTIGAAALLTAAPALAQDAQGPTDPPATPAAASDTSSSGALKKISLEKKIEIQHLRPHDKRGLNVFETPKEPGVAFTGFKLDWGAAFTQQFQGLTHENSASPVMKPVATGGEYNANQLMDIGKGFNNATANLYLDAQLAPGIRVALSTYLSSRHHQETWVKDGYLLIDDSPIDVPALKTLMQYVTVRAGHFEINYGDAHFRRSDNGNAIYNPFVGNYILDAFTTEVGAEVYARHKGLMAMAGVTGGEIKGNVLTPDDRSPAFYGKLGVDRQLTPDLRVRLTGSAYRNEKSPANTLYAGDRAGSRYYFVLENTQATSNGNYSSGLVNPAFRREVTAFQINPFVKYQGLELFGIVEQAKGRSASESVERTWNHYAVDAIYRFLADEKLYVGARYNVAKGELQGIANDVSLDRAALGAGWFITPAILMKGEWVTQKYNDFPLTDIRHGGKFSGFVVEGVVSF
ncbi:MAG TPA: hypothetical protein VGE02_14955 [Gemmatimonadales bacterium]